MWDSTATVEENLIEANTGASGGAVSIRNYSHAVLADNHILSNIAETGNGGGIQVDSTWATVPEPATMALMGLGLAGLAGLRRRRKDE